MCVSIHSVWLIFHLATWRIHMHEQMEIYRKENWLKNHLKKKKYLSRHFSIELAKLTFISFFLFFVNENKQRIEIETKLNEMNRYDMTVYEYMRSVFFGNTILNWCAQQCHNDEYTLSFWRTAGTLLIWSIFFLAIILTIVLRENQLIATNGSFPTKLSCVSIISFDSLCKKLNQVSILC